MSWNIKELHSQVPLVAPEKITMANRLRERCSSIASTMIGRTRVMLSSLSPLPRRHGDRSTSLFDPLVLPVLVAPAPYLTEHIFDTGEPTMQADSVRTNV